MDNELIIRTLNRPPRKADVRPLCAVLFGCKGVTKYHCFSKMFEATKTLVEGSDILLF